MHYSKDVLNFLQDANCLEEMYFMLEMYSIRNEWELWAEKTKLLAYEAIPLMNGVDPRSWQESTNNEKYLHGEMVQSIKRCLDLARHEGFVACTPSEWLTWGRIHGLDKLMLKSQDWVSQPDVCMWPLFEFAVNKATEVAAQKEKVEDNQTENVIPKPEANACETGIEPDSDIARLFPSVPYSVLEKMFPAGGKWEKWTKRAGRNGLSDARSGRGLYNPHTASCWWLTKKKPEGWDSARCLKVLATNYPEETQDYHHLLFPNAN